MAAGCTLVTTDSKGCRDYAIPNRTALVAPPKNINIITSYIKFLLDNDDKRIFLAKQGNNFIQQFSWKNAVDKMENLLLSSPK